MANNRSALILNVDDNEAGRYAKTRALRRADGIEVKEAETGGDALRLVEERRPALVLLDVKLPDINGLEVCRRIKRDRPEILVLQISASFTSGRDRISSAVMTIMRSASGVGTGSPSADRKTPEMSAQTPSRRRAVRSSSLETS